MHYGERWTQIVKFLHHTSRDGPTRQCSTEGYPLLRLTCVTNSAKREMRGPQDCHQCGSEYNGSKILSCESVEQAPYQHWQPNSQYSQRDPCWRAIDPEGFGRIPPSPLKIAE